MSKLLKELKGEQVELKKYRRKELLALRRVPQNVALERNTWYHLGINSDQQYIYCLRRMLDPIKEHVDNNFNPMPDNLVKEFDPIREKIADLMKRTSAMLSTGRFDEYDEVLAQAEELKDRLSSVRKHHYDRMQKGGDVSTLKIDLVYINILQESQELLSIMRHQLRAGNRFYGNN